MIAEIRNGAVASELYIILRGCWPDRLTVLKGIGVRTVLCGGFNRRFVPLATSMGIRVISGFGGDARINIEALARGDAAAEIRPKKMRGLAQQ